MSANAYVGVELDTQTLDRWLARTSIERALRAELPHVRGVVLDVGCGHQPYRDLLMSAPSSAERVIGVDIPSDKYGGHDIAWDGRALPVATASVDHVLLTEVLEHCPEPGVVLAEAWRALRPGGRLFLTVPFLWPLHDSPNDEWRYTPFALDRLLSGAGFEQVRLTGTGGWDASLAQMLGLWARRRSMSARRRALVSAALRPVIGWLGRRDVAPTTFHNGVMLTGLAGSAVKPEAAT